MRKRSLALVLVLALAAGFAFAADDVTGLWKQMSDKGVLQSLTYLYKYQGKLYGRILVTYEDDGSLSDTYLQQKNVSDKLRGDPKTCGLDFVYGLEDKGKEWAGLIMDPSEGKEYDCRAWLEGGKLKLRGQLKGLGFLGRTQTWLKAQASDMPSGVPLPDPAKFVPVIPKAK